MADFSITSFFKIHLSNALFNLLAKMEMFRIVRKTSNIEVSCLLFTSTNPLLPLKQTLISLILSMYVGFQFP